MSTAHDKYIALQRHRNAAPLALDPRSTALVIVDMQESPPRRSPGPTSASCPA
jgi:hypothetical protein